MKKNIILGALALGATVFAVNAQALTVSGGSFTNAQEVTEISQSGTLSYFDSNLGILDSVVFTFAGEGISSFTAQNNAGQSQNFIISSDVQLFYSSVDAGIDAVLAAVANPQVIVDFTTGVQTLASGASASFGPFASSNLEVYNIAAVDAAALVQAGGGTFSIDCDSLSGISVFGGGGNIATTQSTSAACGASIVYNYHVNTNVPEPTGLGLIGLGLAGLTAVSRRKRG